jgi:DNA repair protein RadA/Sms
MVPGADLGIAIALASSINKVAVDASPGVVGGIGLSGEGRAGSGIERRLMEVSRMGFTKAMIPAKTTANIPKGLNMKIIPVANIRRAITTTLGVGKPPPAAHTRRGRRVVSPKTDRLLRHG